MWGEELCTVHVVTLFPNLPHRRGLPRVLYRLWLNQEPTGFCGLGWVSAGFEPSTAALQSGYTSIEPSQLTMCVCLPYCLFLELFILRFVHLQYGDLDLTCTLYIVNQHFFYAYK